MLHGVFAATRLPSRPVGLHWPDLLASASGALDCASPRGLGLAALCSALGGPANKQLRKVIELFTREGQISPTGRTTSRPALSVCYHRRQALHQPTSLIQEAWRLSMSRSDSAAATTNARHDMSSSGRLVQIHPRSTPSVPRICNSALLSTATLGACQLTSPLLMEQHESSYHTRDSTPGGPARTGRVSVHKAKRNLSNACIWGGLNVHHSQHSLVADHFLVRQSSPWPAAIGMRDQQRCSLEALPPPTAANPVRLALRFCWS